SSLARAPMRSARLAASTTSAPAAASTRAKRAPRPLDAPVTMATRPSSRNGASGSKSLMGSHSTIASMWELRRDEARRLFLRAQGVLGPPDRRAGVGGVLRQVGAVQLDTISVLARSHELVAYARLGPVGRAAVEGSYWGRPVRAFEGIAHAYCILPIELWPHLAARRRLSARRIHPRRPPDD